MTATARKASSLAAIHPILFAGLCVLFGAGGGALAFVFDVILLGAFGTGGNFATPGLFLIVFLVGLVSPPAILAWTRRQAQRDDRRSQAVEPVLALSTATTEPENEKAANEQALAVEPAAQTKQPAETSQALPNDGQAQLEQKSAQGQRLSEGRASPENRKLAQPSSHPSAVLGPIVIDPTYLGRASKRKRRLATGTIAVLLAFATGLLLGNEDRFPYAGRIFTSALDRLYGFADTLGVDLPGDDAAAPDSKFGEVYKRLGIAPLAARLERESDVNRGLIRLLRETCDKEGIYAVGQGLQNSGNARIAANALLGYAAACGNGEGDKYAAANILYSLADYDRVVAIMTEMIATRPAFANFHYLRAAALAGEKRYSEALTDYANTIELTDNQRNIGEWVFLEMAEAYAALKQYCSAITPIQTWMALDPTTRDTPKTRRLMLDYSKQGDCELRYATGSDTFTHGGGNIIRTKVSVNGVEGNFLVDTGATFVVLTADFAQRSKVEVTKQLVTMETANGNVQDTLGRAANIRVGKVAAADVPILVQSHQLPRDVDGLLGMSFLSRFDFSIGKRDWTLAQKK